VIARPQTPDVPLEQDGHARPAAERQDELVSPELVLVDPTLARWAREHLPERGETATRVPPAPRPAPSKQEPLAVASDTTARTRPAATARPRRRRRAAGLTVSVLIGLASAAVLVYLGVRSEAHPTLVEPAAPSESNGSTQAATPPPEPVAPAGGVPTSRRFAWAPRAGASGYHVELFKGPVLVFRADSPKPEIVIPKRWRLNGRVHTLVPGSYRWYVWPRVAGRRQARAIVQAKLILPTR
jgi:hypothetical protein